VGVGWRLVAGALEGGPEEDRCRHQYGQTGSHHISFRDARTRSAFASRSVHRACRSRDWSSVTRSGQHCSASPEDCSPSVAATRVLRSLLFDVEPTDPLVLGAVSALLLGVATAASLLPARRAMRVSPTEVLRTESRGRTRGDGGGALRVGRMMRPPSRWGRVEGRRTDTFRRCERVGEGAPGLQPPSPPAGLAGWAVELEAGGARMGTGAVSRSNRVGG
jgi:hypothetical protein